MSEHSHADNHSPMRYVKIYFVLLFLLMVSVAGPMLGHRALTLITAFGIAIVKALMVCAYFMHLNIEKRYIWYLLYGMLLLVGIFFSGVATDIMRPKGRNWVNQSAENLIQEHANKKPSDEHGGHHE